MIKRITYVIAALVILILLLFQKRFILTVSLIIAAGIVQYVSHKRDIPLDLGHVFFLGIIAARTEGITTGIAFILLAGGLPRMIADEVDDSFFVIYPIQTLFVIIASFTGFMNIIISGIAISFLAYALSAVICSKILDEEILEMVEEVYLPFLLSIGYFISFSGLIVMLLA